MTHQIKSIPAINWKKRLLVSLLLAMTVLFLHHDAFAGSDIQHFTFKTVLTNTGVDLDAHGRVEGSLVRQGNAYNQRLKVSASRLDPDTTYVLATLLPAP